MKKTLLYPVFGIIVIIGILHYFGQVFYLYWDLRWYDDLAHFLGGLSMGFLCLWIWYQSGLFGKSVPSKKSAFILAFVAGMIISFGWEFFEFTYGIAAPIGSYILDTYNDLLYDFLGVILAGIVGGRNYFYE